MKYTIDVSSTTDWAKIYSPSVFTSFRWIKTSSCAIFSKNIITIQTHSTDPLDISFEVETEIPIQKIMVEKGDRGDVIIDIGDSLGSTYSFTHDFILGGGYNKVEFVLEKGKLFPMNSTPSIFVKPLRKGEKKVLLVIDVHGWAFDFVARGIREYSKYNVTIKRWRDLSILDPVEYDIVFFFNYSCFQALSHNIINKFIQSPIKKTIGIRAFQVDCDEPVTGWNNGCVSQEIYDDLKKRKPHLKLFITRNGVDTKIFTPIDRPLDRFRVGWAGNENRPEKRFYLLAQLNKKFPIVTQKSYSHSKNKPRDEMLKFYKDIDVYINLSTSEGFSQTLLEAAATGLPIVCTDVGGHRMFVDKEWLITPQPDKEVLKQLEEKLTILKSNPKLRFEVGQRNLDKVNKEWSWEHVVKDYERMWES